MCHREPGPAGRPQPATLCRSPAPRSPVKLLVEPVPVALQSVCWETWGWHSFSGLPLCSQPCGYVIPAPPSLLPLAGSPLWGVLREGRSSEWGWGGQA